MTGSRTDAAIAAELAAAESVAPRRRNPAARRRAILQAAAEMIVEDGAASLTHRAVAHRSGESLGSTTRYFSSIDELRESAMEVLAQELDRYLDEVEQALASTDDFPTSCAALMRDFLDDPRAVRSSIALLTAVDPEPRVHELARLWSDRFRQILAGSVGDEPAHALESYLNGLTMYVALFGAAVSPARIAAAVRALLTIPTTRNTGE